MYRSRDARYTTPNAMIPFGEPWMPSRVARVAFDLS
jgi:hypothetical protein